MEYSQTKAYLYHRVPKDMRGHVLYPLNNLGELHPDLYITKAAKYGDREHTMEQFIPTLRSAWNDVIHFTAVHPQELKQALVDAGMEKKELKFYQIDPTLLDPQQTTVYLQNQKMKENRMDPENFTDYDPEHLNAYATLPPATKEYYKVMFDKGDKPLLFVGVPHILYKGSLDVSNLPIVVV